MADLESIIQDELGAVSEYAALARDTSDHTLRALLLSIVADEYGHARSFSIMQDLMGDGGES